MLRAHQSIDHRRDFLVSFLGVFAALSFVLNAILIVHISHPTLWRDLQLRRLHPPAVRAGDHVRGRADAPVTVIEYSDFECPFCQEMHTTLRRAAEEGRIRWVFRDSPLTSIHPLSFEEAESAWCAGEQGKFWEYADALYAAQDHIDKARNLDQQLYTVAQGIHADTVAFKACLDSGRMSETIKTQMTEAASLRIDGTPTLFINGKRHEGLVSYEKLLAERSQN